MALARLGDGAEDEFLEGGNCSLKESPPPTGGVGPGGGFSSPACCQSTGQWTQHARLAPNVQRASYPLCACDAGCGSLVYLAV